MPIYDAFNLIGSLVQSAPGATGPPSPTSTHLLLLPPPPAASSPQFIHFTAACKGERRGGGGGRRRTASIETLGFNWPGGSFRTEMARPSPSIPPRPVSSTSNFPPNAQCNLATINNNQIIIKTIKINAWQRCQLRSDSMATV